MGESRLSRSPVWRSLWDAEASLIRIRPSSTVSAASHNWRVNNNSLPTHTPTTIRIILSGHDSEVFGPSPQLALTEMKTSTSDKRSFAYTSWIWLSAWSSLSAIKLSRIHSHLHTYFVLSLVMGKRRSTFTCSLHQDAVGVSRHGANLGRSGHTNSRPSPQFSWL